MVQGMTSGRKPLKNHQCRQAVWRGKCLYCCLAMLMLLCGTAVGEEDVEHARDLHAAGAILSLEYFAADARARHPGRVIDAKLHYEDSHGHHVYEILILDRRGEVWELEYDARNGDLIEIEPGGD